MSSPFAHNYRRRSHSASSPSPSPAPKSTWRRAIKRTHSSHRNSSSVLDHSFSRVWDSGSWNRGKRARREVSPSLNDFTGASSPLYAESRSSASTSSAPHTPVFAATSAEFLLFPNRNKDREDSTAPSTNPITTGHFGDADDVSEADLVRLRSDAFWELRRSVAESGEGLIRRMREYEDSRSKCGVYSRARGIERRRRKRNSPSVPTTRPVRRTHSSDSDDDDVQIFSGDSFERIPCPKRASSLGRMDPRNCTVSRREDSSPSRRSTVEVGDDSMDYINTGDISPSRSAFSSASPAFTFSAYTGSSTPALSYTSLSSPDFSLAPLPSSPIQVGHRADTHLYSPITSQASSPFNFTSNTSSHTAFISSSASRTEKAIAALSLAMANGAGGLSDYEALHAYEPSSILGDSSQAGELWH
ncbi:hypothetical protein BJ138DRAFT_1122761 [Hygrophoropsis aurantiaca]|uniref:Uncharacterized protein n=1 Tax=Hygrophoropsis aurantiaca TaxID=72124 RepID=A0ACB8ARJ9_9AGAM|nr:hypothetical protein BJ138DRAFT_1122761 [Hygrophoropsis aurantiaca]